MFQVKFVDLIMSRTISYISSNILYNATLKRILITFDFSS